MLLKIKMMINLFEPKFIIGPGEAGGLLEQEIEAAHPEETIEPSDTNLMVIQPPCVVVIEPGELLPE
mgnify:CR=1 FL=1